MKNTSRAFFALAGCAAAAAGLALYAMAPGFASEEKKEPFMGRNIAHRGLHRIDKSVPENSLAAFRAAVEGGYGVELDVHLTADDRLVVFHDDDLERMCGVQSEIEEMTLAELRTCRLAGTGESIPLLSEVLEVVDGKVPLVIELKRGSRNDELCERVQDLLRGYSGNVCIESFDPFIVRWWRKNAPEVLRGQLSAPGDRLGGCSRFERFILSNMLTNFLGRPQFIAYDVQGKKPLLARIARRLGAMRFGWTSHDWVNEEDNDAVIFEYYRPRQKYK